MIKNQIHPQFITDTAGEKLVILTQQEFDALIDELEVQEDIALYEEAKKDDNGKRILFSEYLKNRKENNG